MRRVCRSLRSSAIVCVLLILMVPATGLAQAVAKVEIKKAPVRALDPDFSYTSKERRDPFEPVFLAKMRANRAGANSKEGYELEELRLVGILKTTGGRLAMMEDTQGKGLTFKKGDFFNKNTWVVDIEEQKVMVAYRVKGDIRKVAIDIPRK
ncbi:MAG: Pilus assembly protein, PilP [Deltaproteobacteria bacterium]|nr:Pilus assembly protein, PilP [Deltaproteobacteria bacterium]